MDMKEAIASAKRYVQELYADEGISNLGLEEIELSPGGDGWQVTVAFSRPWNTPRTRAQELLENLGAAPGLRRSYKVVTLGPSGGLISIKDRVAAQDAA
jgi:hypothetical protein